MFSGESSIGLVLHSVTMAIFTAGTLKGMPYIFLDLMVKFLDPLTSVFPLCKASPSLKHPFPVHMVSLSLPEVSPHIPCEASILLK